MADETRPRADDSADSTRWAPDGSPDDTRTAYIDEIPTTPAPQPVGTTGADEAPGAPRTRRRLQISRPQFSRPQFSRPQFSRPQFSRPQFSRAAGLRLSRPTIGAISLDPRAAAALVGVVVGAALLVLTAIGLQGCQLLTGTSSCGTGPGFVGLLVIFALAVLAGRALLGLLHLPDPGSTSFLAVALTSVVALLFLVDVLDTWPMIIVIPAVSAATYLFAWWLATQFVAEDGDGHR